MYMLAHAYAVLAVTLVAKTVGALSVIPLIAHIVTADTAGSGHMVQRHAITLTHKQA